MACNYCFPTLMHGLFSHIAYNMIYIKIITRSSLCVQVFRQRQLSGNSTLVTHARISMFVFFFNSIMTEWVKTRKAISVPWKKGVGSGG